ncbi:MAG: glycosyltransferase family 4 protein [bacterium]
MKICLVSSFQKISGAGRQAFLLAGSLRRAGHELFLVSPEEESEIPLPCQEHSLASQSLIKYEKVAPVSLKDFLYNKRGFYDLVHFFGGRVDPLLIEMLGRLDKPVIIRPTGFRLDLPEGRLKADAYIGISELLYQNLRGMKSGKTVVKIVNAVDASRYAPLTDKEERERLKKSLGFSGGDRIVLFVGGFHREKGAALMISGWPMVRSAFPEAVLVIAGPLCTICRKKCESAEAGDEPFTDRFNRLAGLLTGKFSSLLEKEEGIRFLGSVPDPLPYL